MLESSQRIGRSPGRLLAQQALAQAQGRWRVVAAELTGGKASHCLALRSICDGALRICSRACSSTVNTLQTKDWPAHECFMSWHPEGVSEHSAAELWKGMKRMSQYLQCL